MSEQTHNQQQMSYRPAMEDEIDLRELFVRVWKRKWWVTGITALSMLLAVAYLLIAKPVYRAELFMMPPFTSNIDALNLETWNFVHTLTPKDAFKLLLKQLISKNNMKMYYEKAELDKIYRTSEGQSANDALEKFVDALALDAPKNNLVPTSISLEGVSSELMASHLIAYTRFVESKVVKNLIDDLYSRRDNKIKLLEQKITSEREIARLQLQDRIALLEEAITIANIVDINEVGANDKYTTPGQNINIVNINELYLRGTKALVAEIKVLKARVSNDPFIAELRVLQVELETLREIKVDSSTITAATIDLQAIVPESPERPKKLLVLVASILLGGMLGLVVALAVPAHEEKPLA